MPPTLEHHFTLHAIFAKEAVNVKQILGGPQRIIVPLTGGWLKGSGLEADILPGSGDWFLVSTSSQVNPIDSDLNSLNLITRVT